MRTSKPQSRPQTLKQAKASFKARGQPAVSSTQKRQLERGAELLQRADRLKEQEKRRKEFLRKREEKDLKRKEPQQHALLGTQVRLDKFGYKSSQFHLGAFLKRPEPAMPERPIAVQEPWEDEYESFDDDALLDVLQSPADGPEANFKKAAPAETSPCQTKIGGTLNDEDPHAWDWLESSSQIAQELGEEVANSSSKSRVPSFSSSDFDITEDDIQMLESAAVLNDKIATSTTTMLDINRKALDKRLMPPPLLPAKHVKPSAKSSVPLIPKSPSTSPADFGFSFADLECLAAEEIQLSQYNPP